MIVDTSVLVSLLREEPESTRFVPAMSRSRDGLKMSVVNYVETGIVIDDNDSKLLSERLDSVIDYWNIELVAVSAHHARLAREAYRRFGKGHHPAKLNFGDCFSYALASATGEALLFKGDDFSKTDIEAVSTPT
ncbi:type II toxin-antitoxin system VapC family toxin [Sphingomonas sp.]|uniref:type II toxin-antitoxin system VapC family toxin n=1 Tax=Sphingomonas sp. TaxID=28214 RepID=UPI003B00DBD9